MKKNPPPPANCAIVKDLNGKIQGTKDAQTRLERVKVNARNFYIRAIIELQTRFCFDDDIFSFIDILQPATARDFRVHVSLAVVLKRFPILSGDIPDPQTLDNEWRGHKSLRFSLFSKESNAEVSDMDCLDYWKVIFSLKDALGNLKFPSLVKVVTLLFSLPVSNAVAERLYSKLKNIKTEKRNLLKDITVASLIKIKDWIKLQGKPLDQIIFPDELINFVLKVKANQTIELA